MAPGSVLIATIPGDWPWGEGPCWTLTMDCSYPNSHQVAGLPIFKWMGTLAAGKSDWLMNLFTHPSFIHSWFLFSRHFGLLLCASRPYAGCETERRVANIRSLF